MDLATPFSCHFYIVFDVVLCLLNLSNIIENTLKNASPVYRPFSITENLKRTSSVHTRSRENLGAKILVFQILSAQKHAKVHILFAQYFVNYLTCTFCRLPSLTSMVLNHFSDMIKVRTKGTDPGIPHKMEGNFKLNFITSKTLSKHWCTGKENLEGCADSGKGESQRDNLVMLCKFFCAYRLPAI